MHGGRITIFVKSLCSLCGVEDVDSAVYKFLATAGLEDQDGLGTRCRL